MSALSDAVKCGIIPKPGRWRSKSFAKLTRGEEVCRFIEEFCLVPEGAHVGEPIHLEPFQVAFILAIYDNPAGTRRAYLSMARKNGKTALIACLVLAHLIAEPAVLNSQIVSGALSRDQAGIVFALAEKMVNLSPILSQHIKITPSKKMLVSLGLNVQYHALAAEGTKAHGLSPVLAILDEVGQIVGASSPFVDAITTSQGAHATPLLIAISTSAASDADMFSLWCDDAETSNDPHIVSHIYKADEKSNLLDKRQWKKANPALGAFRQEKDLAEQLKQAFRMPSEENKARNLLLNERIALESRYISANVWRENNAPPDMSVFTKYETAIGLDLSARVDLTAAVIAAKDDAGFVHTFPFVFCPSEGIEARSQRDRTPYDQWVREGYMIPLGGRSMDYDQIAEFLRDKLEEMGIRPTAVCFDRWRIDIFKKACTDAGAFSEAAWIEVGQGFKDQSPSLENLTTLLLGGKIKHGGHPLLTMAASNAIAQFDPAGAVKIAKNKSTLRIDPLIALHQAVFAVTEGATEPMLDVAAWIG